MSQSERFYELLDIMKKTHDAKRHDYANPDDVFANFRTCEQAGIPAWKGCCVRIGDKFSRLMSFLKQEELKVKDESIKDTLIDLANYALICAILYDEEKEKGNNPFARSEAYIEHRKEFPYYPDKPKEDEGTRRGRETAEYLKSLGYMGGKKDKENKKAEEGVITAPMMEME